MSPGRTCRRPIRIGGASGALTDREHGIPRMAETAEVDVIVGDWMAEATMAAQGAANALQAKQSKNKAQNGGLFSQSNTSAQYAPNLLDCFEPAIENLKRNGIKLAVNAGGSDTEILANLIKQLCIDRGHPMNVAWIEGDDVMEKVRELSARGEQFRSLNRGKDVTLHEWSFEPVAAQAYLGGLGIAAAFRKGADIVICGRVADASPTIGAAAWWHGWDDSNLDELAAALVCGHLIECGGYVTGGNYCGFKKLLQTNKHLDIGFPIAEVDHLGECILTKERNTGGAVDVLNTTSQLLYEIQGPLYYNSDVTASLENIQMEEISENRATRHRQQPKITADGGYQAEYHVFFVGLDIEEKARWTEDYVRECLGETAANLKTLKFHLNGTSPIDAPSQDAATVDLRIVAQGFDIELFNMQNPNSFGRKVRTLILESASRVSLSNNGRQVLSKPFEEYYVALFSQLEITQKVHLLYNNDNIINILIPKTMKIYPRQ